PGRAARNARAPASGPDDEGGARAQDAGRTVPQAAAAVERRADVGAARAAVMGQIVTFYSYKGGTGRTMALANVAWILAAAGLLPAAGHTVLMVDGDLEAPGVHRYFPPLLSDKELLTSTGVIDIVIDFTVQATTPLPAGAREEDWYLPAADVLRYAVSIEWD